MGATFTIAPLLPHHGCHMSAMGATFRIFALGIKVPGTDFRICRSRCGSACQAPFIPFIGATPNIFLTPLWHLKMVNVAPF